MKLKNTLYLASFCVKLFKIKKKMLKAKISEKRLMF